MNVDLASDCLIERGVSLDSDWLPWTGSGVMPPPAEGWNDDEVGPVVYCNQPLDEGAMGCKDGHTACSRAPHSDPYHVSHGDTTATAWVRRDHRRPTGLLRRLIHA